MVRGSRHFLGYPHQFPSKRSRQAIKETNACTCTNRNAWMHKHAVPGLGRNHEKRSNAGSGGTERVTPNPGSCPAENLLCGWFRRLVCSWHGRASALWHFMGFGGSLTPAPPTHGPSPGSLGSSLATATHFFRVCHVLSFENRFRSVRPRPKGSGFLGLAFLSYLRRRLPIHPAS